jgi:hypothetical protein
MRITMPKIFMGATRRLNPKTKKMVETPNQPIKTNPTENG